MDYTSFRNKYPEFHYREYKINLSGKDLVIDFYYEIPLDYTFKHTIKFKNIPEKIEKETMKNIAFNIGLVEMFSYWKLTASPKIIIQAGLLNDFQKKWWTKLLVKGMGQYFYENKVDFTTNDFIEILSQGQETQWDSARVEGAKVLIPVGGGKDSAVTLELLKGTDQVAAFVVNASEASLKTVEKADVKEVVKVERNIDPKIIDLNAKNYLNGHVPFSASLAFIGILASHLYGYKYLAFSNERSADEENTQYLGQKINHQYSKTLEFENDFRDYNGKYLSNIEYFSFLRPLYEIQIAKIFSKFDKYFEVIRSCNVGMKDNIWCESCPKCLSTYILLSPFLNEANMKRIFSKDLLKEPSLKGLLSKLIDEDKVKPFECVGTKEELRVALNLSNHNFLETWGKNNIPEEFVGLLKGVL